MTDPPVETPPAPPVETPPEPQPGAWRDSLPDDIKGDASISGFADVPSLAKAYVHARSKIGADTAVIPTRETSEEDRATFWAKVGRPEAADKYDLPAEGMPEGFEPDTKRLEHMQGKSFDLGITKQQFAGLARADAEYRNLLTQEVNQTLADQQKAWEQEIRTEFGVAYDQDIQGVNSVIREFGSDALRTVLHDTGLGAHPEMLRFCRKLFHAMKNDEVLGRGKPSGLIMSPEAADAEIRKLYADDKFVKSYEKRGHPQHADAVKKMQELEKIAKPEPATETSLL